jgi:hypothetical protein
LEAGQFKIEGLASCPISYSEREEGEEKREQGAKLSLHKEPLPTIMPLIHS